MLALALTAACSVCIVGAVDDLERSFGATNVRAALGNDQLQVGVSSRGEITALRWPTSGLFDQVHYITLGNAPDGSSSRSLPRFGAQPDMGLFVGLVFDDGGERHTEWLRDAAWSATVSYLSNTASPVRTEFRSSSRGLTAVQELWLRPDAPLLALRIEVQAGRANATLPVAVVFFENLAPCDLRIPGQPVADWLYDAPGSDQANDFGLLFSQRGDALLHFKPAAADEWRQALGEQIELIAADPAGHGAADAVVDQLVLEQAAGTFFAIGGDRAASGHQVGRYDPADVARPQDAFFDARDGALSAQPAALGSVDGALLFGLPADQPNLTIFVAGGDSAGAALGLLESARLDQFSGLVAAVTNADAAIERAIATPDTDDETVRDVAKRAIRQALASQSDSGAIPASVGGQPPLALDCPAQSAFVADALAVAGQTAAADRQRRFLAAAQRQQDDADGPSGTFWSCYNTDRSIGSGWPFPIDATGLTIWSWWRQAQQLDADRQGDAAQKFLQDLIEPIRLAADAIVGCVDPGTDLPCATSAGDQGNPAVGLLGSATVVTGLRAAASAFDRLRQDPERAATYRARADAIAVAVSEHLVDNAGLLIGSAAARALALYPAGLLDSGSGNKQAEIDRIASELQADLGLQTSGVQDLGLRLWALVSATAEKSPQREQLRPLIDAFFWASDPATRQYGLAQVAVDDTGDGTADRLDQRVGTPHLLNGAFGYLIAVKFFGRRPAAASMGPVDNCFCGAPIARGDRSPVDSATTWPRVIVGVLFGLFWIARRGAQRWSSSSNSSADRARHPTG